MQEEERSRWPVSGLLVVAAVVGGALWLQKPYESLRPRPLGDPGTYDTIGEAPVVARLWQDPFQVVEAHESSGRGGTLPEGAVDLHSLGFLREGILKRLLESSRARPLDAAGEPGAVEDVVLMPVLVPGSKWPVDAEARRRERHAVLSALGRMGYDPAWDKRIAFVTTRWRPERDPYDADLETIRLVEDSSSELEEDRTCQVPYEWFECKARGRAGPRPRHVLVLWIDESFFGKHILKGLDLFLTELLDRSVPMVQALDDRSMSIRVLGPTSSTSLLAIADSLARTAASRDPGLRSGGRRMAPEDWPAWTSDQTLSALGTVARTVFPAHHGLHEGAGSYPSRPQIEALAHDLVTRIEGVIGLEYEDRARDRTVRAIGRELEDPSGGLPIRRPEIFLRTLINGNKAVVDAAFRNLPKGIAASRLDPRLDVEMTVIAWYEDIFTEILSDRRGPGWEARRRFVGEALRPYMEMIEASRHGIPPIVVRDYPSERVLRATVRSLVSTFAPSAAGRGETKPLSEEEQNEGERMHARVEALLGYVEPPPGWDARVTGQVRFLQRLLASEEELVGAVAPFVADLLVEDPAPQDDAREGAAEDDPTPRRVAREDDPAVQEKAREAVANWTTFVLRAVLNRPTATQSELRRELHDRILPYLQSLDASGLEALRRELSGYLADLPDGLDEATLDFASWSGAGMARVESELALFITPPGEDTAQAVRIAEGISQLIRWNGISDAIESPDATGGDLWEEACRSFPLLFANYPGVRRADLDAVARDLLARFPGPGSGDLTRYVIETAEDRRQLVLGHPALADLAPMQRSLTLRELLLFEVARWEFRLVEFARPRTPQASAFRFQLKLEQALRRGTPESFDRESFLARAVAIIEEGFARDGWVASESGRRRPLPPSLLGAAIESGLPIDERRDEVHTALLEWSKRTSVFLDLPTRHLAQLGLAGSTDRGMEEIQGYVETYGRVSGILSRVEFFSSHATVSERSLVRALGDAPAAHGADHGTAECATVVDALLAEVLGEHAAPGRPARQRFFSTVIPDDRTLGTLVDELAERGIDLDDDGDVIALVSEWDTFYGRELPAELIRALEAREEGLVGADRVVSFHYLRGLDGARLEDEPDEEPAALGKIAAATAALDARPPELERPEGSSQFDYVRRLGDQLVRWVEDRRRAGDPQRIRAIGILGSDVYDKLLVLQALEERFPGAVFFTTDLDARLVQSDQYDHTRNLLIGSSHGLTLDDDLQGGVPAFRGSYQTATFLACQIALGGVEGTEHVVPAPAARTEPRPVPSPAPPDPLPPLLDETLEGVSPPAADAGARRSGTLAAEAPPAGATVYAITKANLQGHLVPRVFEVGRSGAYDMSAPSAGDGIVVHPERDSGRPTGRGVVKILLSAILLFLLLIPFSRQLRRYLFHRREMDGEARRAMDLSWAAFAVLLAVLCATVVVDGRQARPEPFELFEGISVWPTVFGRIVAISVGIYFLLWTRYAMQRNSADLEAGLGLPNRPEEAKRLVERVAEAWGSARGPGAVVAVLRTVWEWRGGIGVGGWRDDVADSRTSARGSGTAVESMDVRVLWQEYLRRGRSSARAARVLPHVLAFSGVAVLVYLAGDSRVPPVRGDFARVAESLSFYGVSFFIILLTFLVIDATRLFERFVRLLTRIHTEWPDQARDDAYRRKKLPPEAADYFLDVELVTRRSELIGRLILYPFVLLFIVVVSRNGYFDDWAWPLSLLGVLGILFVAALGPGFLLRRAAEDARQESLRSMRDVMARLTQADAVAAEEPERAEPAPPERAEEAYQRVRERIHMAAEEIRRTRRGAFSSYMQSPVTQALLLPFGGFGVVALLEALVYLGL